MRHFFSTGFSITKSPGGFNSAVMDDAIWRGATLFMLVVVTAIIAILAR